MKNLEHSLIVGGVSALFVLSGCSSNEIANHPKLTTTAPSQRATPTARPTITKRTVYRESETGTKAGKLEAEFLEQSDNKASFTLHASNSASEVSSIGRNISCQKDNGIVGEVAVVFSAKEKPETFVNVELKPSTALIGSFCLNGTFRSGTELDKLMVLLTGAAKNGNPNIPIPPVITI